MVLYSSTVLEWLSLCLVVLTLIWPSAMWQVFSIYVCSLLYMCCLTHVLKMYLYDQDSWIEQILFNFFVCGECFGECFVYCLLFILVYYMFFIDVKCLFVFQLRLVSLLCLLHMYMTCRYGCIFFLLNRSTCEWRGSEYRRRTWWVLFWCFVKLRYYMYTTRTASVRVPLPGELLF